MTHFIDQASLAEALELSIRRVQQLKELGVLIEETEGGFDLRANKRRYVLYSSGNMAAVLDDIEQLTADLDNAFSELSAEPNLDSLRERARKIGPLVGHLDSAMGLANAMARPGSRELLSGFRDMLIGGVAGYLLDKCGLRPESPAQMTAGRDAAPPKNA